VRRVHAMNRVAIATALVVIVCITAAISLFALWTLGIGYDSLLVRAEAPLAGS
jgi:hypothetical protein